MLDLKSLGMWSSKEHIVTSSSMYFYFIFQMRFWYVAQDELKYETPLPQSPPGAGATRVCHHARLVFHSWICWSAAVRLSRHTPENSVGSRECACHPLLFLLNLKHSSNWKIGKGRRKRGTTLWLRHALRCTPLFHVTPSMTLKSPEIQRCGQLCPSSSSISVRIVTF